MHWKDISLTVPENECYGMEALKHAPNQLMRELYCYSMARGRYGAEKQKTDSRLHGAQLKSATQHMVNAIQLIWPEDEVRFKNGPYVNWNILKVLLALNENNDLGIAGSASSGKCLGRGTPVVMWNGSLKPVEEVNQGDLLMGDDGTFRNVLSTCSGRSTMFKIKPAKGRDWICNDAHILSLQYARNIYGKKLKAGGRHLLHAKGEKIDIPIRDYLKLGHHTHRELRLYKVAAELPESPVEFDPYCYGAWIADGGVGIPVLHKPKNRMSEYWCQYFNSIGYQITEGNSGSCDSWYAKRPENSGKKSPFIEFIKRSVINGEKRILSHYLKNSIQVRKQLLAGLLDGDGSLDGGCGFQFTTKYKGLADDVEYLANSLGLFVTRRIKYVKGNPYEILSITGDLAGIPTKDKICSANSRGSDPYHTGFTVEELPEDDYFGFVLDGNHRFLLGDFTVTHNTFGMAVWVLVDWFSAPHCTSSFVASTTLGSSQDRLWGTIESLYISANKHMQAKYRMKVGNLVSYKHAIVYEDLVDKDESREYRNAIKALAFETGGQGQKAVDETRGRKNERVRMFTDELAEMEPFVLNVRINLAANEDFVFCGTANPSNKSQNPHKELCQPAHEMGWESVTKDMEGWETRTGYCLFLSGERNPNYQVPREKGRLFKGIMSYEALDDILKRCLGNKNSIEYWRNAIGFWPDVSIELNVLSKAFIQAAQINYEPEWTSETRTVAGFDCAFKSGGDRNCLSFAKVGTDDAGRKVGFFIGTKQYVANVGEEYEKSIARQVVRDCIESGVAPADFGMDISGDGGVMMKAIMEEWSEHDPRALSIHPISSAGSPTERVLSAEDTRTAKQAYDRLITEYWFWMRNAIGNRCIVGLDLRTHADLVAELTERIYEHKGAKVAIETKKDLKVRLGKSCDIADSWVYMTIMCRRAGVEIVGSVEEKEDPIDPALAEYFANLDQNFSQKAEEPEQDDYAYTGSKADEDDFF